MFLTVAFQIFTFSHFINIFTKNNFFYIAETYICQFKAFYTIAHNIIMIIIKDKVYSNNSQQLIKYKFTGLYCYFEINAITAIKMW